jgi:two-component system, LytTR family, sensor kinase
MELPIQDISLTLFRMVLHPTDDHASPSRSDRLGAGQYWLFQIAGWGGVMFLTVMIILFVGQRPTLGQILTNSTQATKDATFTILTCLTGLAASHLLRQIIRFQRWLTWPVRRVAWHALTWWLTLSGINTALAVRFYASPAVGESPASTFTACAMMNLSLLGAWLAIYFLVHYHDAFHQANLDRAKLRAASVENELLVLQAQVNPHFLFNSLNTVRALLPATATTSRTAVTLLADILRATLVEGAKTVIPLSREMEITRNYLAMEKLRFEDDLQITEHIDPATLNRNVPPLMLLTLAENAIKHGLLHPESTGILEINAALLDQSLRLTIRSPGELGKSTMPDSLGLGIQNISERLRLIFGPAATVALSQQDRIVEAKIIIPPSTKTIL